MVRQVTVTQPIADPIGASGRGQPPPVDPTGSMVSDDELSAPSDIAHGSSPAAQDRAMTAAMRPGAQASSARRARASTPPKDARAEDAIGRVLGSYKLLEVIGRGGMGRVYRAEHVKLGRQVALKLLKPEYAVKRDAVARFFQEAKAVNKIRHRNIVEVTDYVELDDGTTFIIMELLEGASLGRTLRVEGPMEQARLLIILVQVCDALEAAHAVGIVHRDLKPDNVFLVHDGEGGELTKLLDFGVAKLLAGGDDGGEDMGYQTAAGSVVGTPAYMSPEQAGGLEIDGRSDVYALGAIMYELFCGQPLFKGRSFGEFVIKHMNEPPVPPRQTPAGSAISPELEEVILRCLAKRPGDRFANVGQLRDQLLTLLGVLDTGLVDFRRADGQRGSGLRGVGSSGLRRRSGERAAASMPSGPTTPSGLSAASGQHSGRSTVTPPVRETLPLVPTDDPDDDAELRSSPGMETRMAIGDVPAPVAPAPTSGRGRWPLYAAIAVGATAAVGYLLATRSGGGGASASNRPATPAPRPSVTPLEPRADKLIFEVRTDPVGAAVYPFGSDRSVCVTPCQLPIDPQDGGSTTQRTYLIKKIGFQDYQLDLALDGSAQTEQLVLLMPEGTGSASTAPRPPRDRPGRDDRRDPPPPDKPDVVADPPPDVVADPPPDKPDDPPPGKKKDKIDRADTLDPFGKGK